ncbi:MAG: isopentenyl-diphosphate Delta-isomerase, partial [bacterium]|nr:isopentenyl-diphosphate Delta-isomerase [bacterium]
MEQVVLVDHAGKEIGVEEKLTVHQKGLLHRAFSIFIFNSKGEVLLQRRAEGKYHSGGLWSNACCSHPRPGETVLEAAHRRLQEEMGFDCGLKEVFTFTYKTPVSKDLIEHEFDHVLIGKHDSAPELNSEEADDWRFENPSTLLQKL